MKSQLRLCQTLQASVVNVFYKSHTVTLNLIILNVAVRYIVLKEREGVWAEIEGAVFSLLLKCSYLWGGKAQDISGIFKMTRCTNE